MVTERSERKRKRLEEKFHEQRGLCWWCKLPMILRKKKSLKTKDVMATIDHLEPHRKEAGPNPPRKFVAAHRKCNNARGHDPQISAKTKAEIKKAVDAYFLLKVFGRKDRRSSKTKQVENR